MREENECSRAIRPPVHSYMAYRTMEKKSHKQVCEHPRPNGLNRVDSIKKGYTTTYLPTPQRIERGLFLSPVTICSCVCFTSAVKLRMREALSGGRLGRGPLFAVGIAASATLRVSPWQWRRRRRCRRRRGSPAIRDVDRPHNTTRSARPLEAYRMKCNRWAARAGDTRAREEERRGPIRRAEVGRCTQTRPTT